MKGITTLVLTALLIFTIAPVKATEGEPPCNSKVKTIDKGDKLILCLNDIKTDGLSLKVFNPDGLIIERTTLKGETNNYEMNKPERGIYWVSMKNGPEVKCERFIVR